MPADVAQKANVMGCIVLGSREGWFAGHGAAGLGKLFLWMKPEQQQRLCRQHMLGKRTPIYQQSLRGTPGVGKAFLVWEQAVVQGELLHKRG